MERRFNAIYDKCRKWADSVNRTTSSKEAMLYSASAINSGTWRLRCKMAFNPSSQNYLEVWLTSSDTILSQANGMVVSIGRTNDRIDLVQIKEGERETVASSSDNLLK